MYHTTGRRFKNAGTGSMLRLSGSPGELEERTFDRTGQGYFALHKALCSHLSSANPLRSWKLGSGELGAWPHASRFPCEAFPSLSGNGSIIACTSLQRADSSWRHGDCAWHHCMSIPTSYGRRSGSRGDSGVGRLIVNADEEGL